MSQNSCARTDIILKRGSRVRSKQQQQQRQGSSNNEQRQESSVISSLPPGPSSTAMMMGIKQEDRNLSVCLLKKKNLN